MLIAGRNIPTKVNIVPSILMVSKYYPPLSYGGTEKYVEVVSRKLAEKGLAVTILGPSTGKEISYEQSGRVLICRFPVYQVKFLEFSNQMRNFIKFSSFDIIHFHTFDVLCRFLRIGLQEPYVITTHGFFWKNPNIFNPMEFFFKIKVLKDNFQNANQIFCVSKKDYENVSNMFGYQPEKLCYLPNGVDIRKFSSLNKQSLKKKYGVEDKIVITEVGRFAPTKGQHIVIDSLRMMPEKIRDRYIAFLAGYPFDNTYFLRIKQSIKANCLEKSVFLLPNVNDNQLIDLYGITDIFVLPSFVEGLPLTLLEAWASKCAVIITAVGGVPYVVKNGVDGFIIPPNDPIALSQKMVDLILNEKKRIDFAERGLERAKTEFDLDSHIEFLIKRYQKILE